MDQGKSIVHKLFFFVIFHFLDDTPVNHLRLSAKFRSLDLQKMLLSNLVICIFKQNICPFPVGFKDILRKHHCVHYVSARHRKKKTNSEKILVFGDHHPKASGIQHSVYIYTYVYLFIYSLVYLFIGLFIYLFIYIFILCIYIYIYTSYIYKLTPAISNQLAVCTSRPHILVLQSPIVHRWTTNFDSKVQFQWLHLTQSLDMFG